MLIKSLKMKNFRQFRGEQSLEFSSDKERNITVVLGDNTSGKTTLLQAFNWCLNGKAKFDTSDNIFSIDRASELSSGETAEVATEIVLIHDETEYLITRTQEYKNVLGVIKANTKPIAKISYKKEDGQTGQIEEIYVKSKINEILPEELSDYFFFDTERIGNISSKSDVTKAVKGLLGLTLLENTMDHLGGKEKKTTVIGRFANSMDLESDSKARKALQRLHVIEEEKLKIEEQILNLDREQSHYESRKEELEAILRDNQNTAELQTRKQKLERQLEIEKKSLQELYKSFLRSFNTNTMNFFAQPLMDRALSLLHEEKIDDKGIRDMNANSIKDIIERGKCVCGTEIIPGNLAHGHLQHELEYLPPHSIGITIRTFIERINTFNSTNEGYYRLLETTYQDIYRAIERIQKSEDEVDEISKEISGKEDMRNTEQNLIEVKNKLRDIDNKRKKLDQDKGGLNKEQEQNQKIYDSSSAVTTKNNEIAEYIKYAQAIYNWIEETYVEKERVIREKIEEKVNSIFSDMYHGDRKVVIDDKYRVSLITTHEEKELETDESKGLETVKNFAFIAGLVDLAREKITSNTGEESMALSSEPYPLIMDAPFSNADERHVKNISNVIPTIAEQVILFVMNKDWKYAENEVGNKVGKKYYLDKTTETLTFIRESVN